MSTMPCHITDEHVWNDPADALDDIDTPTLDSRITGFRITHEDDEHEEFFS